MYKSVNSSIAMTMHNPGSGGFHRGRQSDRDPSWREARARRTRSEDVSNLPFGDKASIVENTLKEIRQRRPSEESRMSCEEIDNLLQDIRRSRSQSASRRPPPPASSPPRLPVDEVAVSRDKLPFGAAQSPVRSRRRSRRRGSSTKSDKKRRTEESDDSSKMRSNEDVAPSFVTLNAETIPAGERCDLGPTCSSGGEPNCRDPIKDCCWNQNPAYQGPGQEEEAPLPPTCPQRPHKESGDKDRDGFYEGQHQAARDDDNTAEEAFDMAKKLKEKLHSVSEELNKVNLAASRRISGDGSASQYVVEEPDDNPESLTITVMDCDVLPSEHHARLKTKKTVTAKQPAGGLSTSDRRRYYIKRVKTLRVRLVLTVL